MSHHHSKCWASIRSLRNQMIGCLSSSLFFSSSLAFSAATQSNPEGVVIQFSGHETETIRKALQDGLDETPIADRIVGPVSSPYALGTISASGISYSVKPLINSIQIQGDTLVFDLAISRMNGFIDRIDFNASGSRSCSFLSIHGTSQDIPVRVQLKPTYSDVGGLDIGLVDSFVSLNRDNFVVEYPAKCNVLYGFNWLVQWALPTVVQYYRDTLAQGIAGAIANGLKTNATTVSQLLALNVTLPFDESVIPPFYASLSVKPSKISVTPERVQTFFSTSITLDPDRVSPFASSADWPTDTNLFGMSWTFLEGILTEAQAKGLIHSTISSNSPAPGLPKMKSIQDFWLKHATWNSVWPEFTKLIPGDQPLKLVVLGGGLYRWQNDPRMDSSADLMIQAMRIRLVAGTRYLADFVFDAKAVFNFSADSKGALIGRLRSFEITDPRAEALNQSPLAEKLPSASGIAALAQKLEGAVEGASPATQELFHVTLPTIKLGHHEVALRSLKTSDAGIYIPLQYVGP